MKASGLFRPIRECAVCGRTAGIGAKKKDDEPVIVAITPLVYRRGLGRRSIQNAPKVQVCDDCLTKAVADQRPSAQSLKLWDAIRSSLGWRYGSMRDAAALNEVKRPKVDGGARLG